MNTKIILLTGASSGIGKITLENLSLNKEYKIICLVRNIDAIKLKSDNIEIFKCDITKLEEIKKIRDQIEIKYKHIDILINNAGYGEFGSIKTKTSNEIEDQFRINFFAHSNMIREFYNLLLKSNDARVINMSSIVGKIVLPFGSYYCASKHAIECLSALRYESNFKIKVITIRPGTITTKFEEIAVSKMKDKIHNDNKLFTIFFIKMYTKAEPPINVYKLIQKAIEAKNPKYSYQTKNAKTNILLSKLAPEKMFNDMLWKKIDKK